MLPIDFESNNSFDVLLQYLSLMKYWWHLNIDSLLKRLNYIAT